MTKSKNNIYVINNQPTLVVTWGLDDRKGDSRGRLSGLDLGSSVRQRDHTGVVLCKCGKQGDKKDHKNIMFSEFTIGYSAKNDRFIYERSVGPVQLSEKMLLIRDDSNR